MWVPLRSVLPQCSYTPLITCAYHTSNPSQSNLFGGSYSANWKYHTRLATRFWYRALEVYEVARDGEGAGIVNLECICITFQTNPINEGNTKDVPFARAEGNCRIEYCAEPLDKDGDTETSSIFSSSSGMKELATSSISSPNTTLLRKTTNRPRSRLRDCLTAGGLIRSMVKAILRTIGLQLARRYRFQHPHQPQTNPDHHRFRLSATRGHNRSTSRNLEEVKRLYRLYEVYRLSWRMGSPNWREL